FAQDIAHWICHSLADACLIETAGKVKADRLGIAGIDNKGAGVAGVTERIAAEGDLVGKGAGEVRPGFSAIAEVVDGDVDGDGRDSTAGQSCRATALGNPQLQACGFSPAGCG